MKLTDPEWQIMNALWEKHPATAREIMEQIPGEVQWAYTTVKTMLARLATKQAVAEQKRGNTSIYRPLLSKQTAQRSALRTIFDRVLNGALEPLAHFLAEEKISEKERRALIAMLQEMDKKDKGGHK